MKSIITKSLFLVLSLGLFFSCQDSGANSGVESGQTASDSQERVQELINSKGEKITITYFADGDNIGVKLVKNGEESTLKANGVGQTGGPLFTDGKIAWEMGGDAQSGKLFNSETEFELYRMDE